MIKINIDNIACVGCKLCVYICPGRVLDMAGGYVATVSDIKSCNVCRACETECPENAIQINQN